MRVLVCHPGRQHSHQLAMALANYGMLAEYFTGVPTNAAALPWWQRLALRRALAAYAIPLDPRLVRHSFVAPFVRRVAARLTSSATAIDWSHRAEAWFDRLAAGRLATLRPDVVVCYENAALETFRAAKRLGIGTVLDAASFHHAWQDRFYQYGESPRAHARIVARKDAELQLADLVLTVSELARESYVASGVSSTAVVSLPIGVDCTLFRPASAPRRAGPLRFVFVGNCTRIKGFDLLLEAANELRRRGTAIVVTVIGGPVRGLAPSDVESVQQLGRLTHEELARELPKHDVIVLPSRFDSFGMVAAEAMACGLPAIVSENVGAKELVTPYDNGLVTPVRDVAALTNAMQWFVDHRDLLPAMSAAARHVVEDYDWRHYRRRAGELFAAYSSVESCAPGATTVTPPIQAVRPSRA